MNLSQQTITEQFDPFYLRGATLNSTRFINIALRNADLRNASAPSLVVQCSTRLDCNLLDGADLTNATLIEASLLGIDLRNVNFTVAVRDLTEADFADSDMRGVNLSGFDLDYVHLQGVHFDPSLSSLQALDWIDRFGVNGVFDKERSGTKRFDGCHVARANLSGANLASADFKNAATADAVRLDGANLTLATFGTADGGVNLTSSSFVGALLDRTRFERTILNNADFTDATLCRPNFLRARFSRSLRPGLPDWFALGLDSQGNFSPANFSNDTLDGETFVNVNLAGLRPGNVGLCFFSGVDLTDADFSSRTLSFVTFDISEGTTCNALTVLADANFNSATLNVVGFLDAVNLNGATFRGTTFSGVDFTDAVLTNADFTGARTTSLNATFNGASCSGANFTNFTVGSRVSFSGANLSRANFTGARFLSTTDFRNANLINATLRNLDFSGLDLRGATFTGADVQGSDFTGANIRGANFSNVVNPEFGSLICGAIADTTTTCPNGQPWCPSRTSTCTHCTDCSP